jgi:hypothetical protein
MEGGRLISDGSNIYARGHRTQSVRYSEEKVPAFSSDFYLLGRTVDLVNDYGWVHVR